MQTMPATYCGVPNETSRPYVSIDLYPSNHPAKLPELLTAQDSKEKH